MFIHTCQPTRKGQQNHRSGDCSWLSSSRSRGLAPTCAQTSHMGRRISKPSSTAGRPRTRGSLSAAFRCGFGFRKRTCTSYDALSPAPARRAAPTPRSARLVRAAAATCSDSCKDRPWKEPEHNVFLFFVFTTIHHTCFPFFSFAPTLRDATRKTLGRVSVHVKCK